MQAEQDGSCEVGDVYEVCATQTIVKPSNNKKYPSAFSIFTVFYSLSWTEQIAVVWGAAGTTCPSVIRYR